MHTHLQQCSMHPAKGPKIPILYAYYFYQKIIQETYIIPSIHPTYFFHTKKRFRFPFVVPSSSSHFDLPAEDEHDHLVLFSNFFCWFWLLMMMMIMIIYLRFLYFFSRRKIGCASQEEKITSQQERERETDETRYCNLYQ